MLVIFKVSPIGGDMAFRLEVKALRTGDWIALDEYHGVEGERMMTRAAYERAVRRSFPIIARREYRIVQFDAPKTRLLFSMTVPLSL